MLAVSEGSFELVADFLSMGATFTVAGSEEAGFVSGAQPPLHVVQNAVQVLGSRDQIEAEIDEIVGSVRDFWQMEPDEVMRQISAYSARCTELTVLLHRAEAMHRQYKQIRTMQVTPLLAELERQFKLASRLIEVRRQDLETLR